MQRIESYSFGRMTISGTTYNRDLIIFPDGRILCPWWRKEGHVLAGGDLTELLAMQPEIIVVGTGASGLMTPEGELVDTLKEREIDLVALPTAKAAERFNTLAADRKTGGCFHLTC